MDQVIDHGKVVRGYMGIGPEDISPAMARSFRLTDTRGVLVADVPAGGPAAHAGIQRGDVITEIKGERMTDSNQLRLKISSMAPGTTVRVKLLREGAEKTVSVKLTEVPGDQARTRPNPRDNGSSALDGVVVAELDYQIRRQLNLPSSVSGVVVTEVADGSPAAEAGLHSGDVIQEVDRVRISSVSDFDRALRRAPGRTVLLLVNRGGGTRYVAIESR